MKNWRVLFSYNRQERSGIFYLCLCILIFQCIYFLTTLWLDEEVSSEFRVDPDWELQLKSLAVQRDSLTIYPFNPNYLTDFKGYLLGLTPSELDRLYAFRAKGGSMHSVEDFKKVSGVSDSLLAILEPYLQFRAAREKNEKDINRYQPTVPPGAEGGSAIEPGDLNTVSASELQSIRGIGPVLSRRIIRFRNALGGFLVNEQLSDVYGLDAEVAARTLRRFRVLTKPEIKLVNVNEASVEELAELVYIPFPLAEAIIRRREELGAIRSFDEITHLEGFPSEKIDRIRLYLGL